MCLTEDRSQRTNDGGGVRKDIKTEAPLSPKLRRAVRGGSFKGFARIEILKLLSLSI